MLEILNSNSIGSTKENTCIPRERAETIAGSCCCHTMGGIACTVVEIFQSLTRPLLPWGSTTESAGGPRGQKVRGRNLSPHCSRPIGRPTVLRFSKKCSPWANIMRSRRRRRDNASGSCNL